MSPHLRQILAELRTRLTELYGARLEQLVLYGSQARGNAEPDSDIDVLVVLRDDVKPSAEIRRTSRIRADLSLQHGVVISCMYVSQRKYDSDDEPLLVNARQEGIPL